MAAEANTFSDVYDQADVLNLLLKYKQVQSQSQVTPQTQHQRFTQPVRLATVTSDSQRECLLPLCAEESWGVVRSQQQQLEVTAAGLTTTRQVLCQVSTSSWMTCTTFQASSTHQTSMHSRSRSLCRRSPSLSSKSPCSLRSRLSSSPWCHNHSSSSSSH